MSYAENTSVPVDRSKAEIEKTFIRYGAGQFAYGWDGNRIMVGFQNGQTVGKWLAPQIEKVYETKKMPLMLISGVE